MARNSINRFQYLIFFFIFLLCSSGTRTVLAAPGLESGSWKICQTGLPGNGKLNGDVLMKLDSESGRWQPAEIETSAVPPGIKIAKMSGLGNDFVILDNRTKWLKDYVCAARSLSAQMHTDGLLVIETSEKADLRMLIYDADGTWEAMCGNGIRCFVKHACDTGICTKKELDVETGAGIKHIVVVKNTDEPNGFQVRVDMGAPELRRSRIPMKGPDAPAVIDETLTVGGYPYKITTVNTGIPHTVVFTDKLPGTKLKEIAPLIENDPLFPEKTNVEFVTVENRHHVNAQVWEVGVGETMACGTGACAMVVAGNLKGILDKEVTVTYPGGDLNIKWEGKGHSVIMTGPAVELFHGVAVTGTLGQKEEGEMMLTLTGSKLTGRARIAAGPAGTKPADYIIDGNLSGTAVEFKLNGKDGSSFIYRGTVSCDGKGMGGTCSPGKSTGTAARTWNAEFLPADGAKAPGRCADSRK
jgi:diaminopimelate epimerase